jgi:DNA polymerase III subunit delta
VSPSSSPGAERRGGAAGSRKETSGGKAAASRVSSVHLLLGPEEGEKAAFVDKVKQGIVAATEEQPEVSRFYAGESRMADVVLCLRNQTLFARRRLVILANLEEVKRAEEVATLVEYLGAPASDATLILLSGGFAGEIDKKILAAVPKESQKIFWEMFDNQKQGWVTNFFRQRKITIDADAVEYILDMVENNTRDMRTECERLALFFGPDATIALENVEHYIYHSKEENVFTLFDRICERELAASAEVLDKILLSREADATQLAGGLLLQFRRLAGFKRMLAENYEAAEAFPKLRIFSKKNQKTYIEASRKFTAADLQTIVQLLAEFDERFRSIRTDLHALLLHLLVYYIVQKAGQGAWRLNLAE